MTDALDRKLAGPPQKPHEAANGLKHIASLTMTKIADGLIDPKLVLAWLLNALGVPAPFISALVPIREAGALLPQVFLAGWLERMSQRRWMWVAGNVGQGGAAGLIALAAVSLTGVAAGWAFVAALALLAFARAAASVSYKDILGKTVSESRRGAVTGFAGSVASAGVVVFALLLMSGLLHGKGALACAVALAALLWLAAAMLFSTLREMPSAPHSGAGNLRVFKLFREDGNFARFVVARGFLVATALAPPYLVLLSGEGNGALGQLGAMVIASAGASFASSYAWGRFADRSSRRVLIAAGLLGAAAMVLAVGFARAGFATTLWAMPVALFVLMVAHHGVRNGRSTYLVDISPDGRRAGYAAAANTAIGVLLLVAGLFGGALSVIGPVAALIGFAAMAVVGAGLALGLEEAEAG